jgi:Zn-dependent protease/predicted transcriptional regulator
MNGTFRLTRVAGVDINVHYTWVFAFALITWTLADNWFPADYPRWAAATYWLTAAIAALTLFASILVHELAHSVVAIARGMPVRSITLFIFGGVSDIGGETRSARDEFVIAIVGPLSSLGLSLIGFLVLRSGVVGDDSPVEGVLIYFTVANLFVGVFNLLPGFPLDGGRVLRAILWGSMGDMSRATRIAATVGIGFGWLLVGGGVVIAITDNVISGLWMGFVGWYLKDSAASVRRGSRRRTLYDVPVSTVMSKPERPVDPGTSISDLVDEYMISYTRRSVPVVASGRVVGIVALQDLEAVHRDLWSQTPVSAVMTGPPLIVVRPDDSVAAAVGLIANHRVNQVLVMDGDELVGIVSRNWAIQTMGR